VTDQTRGDVQGAQWLAGKMRLLELSQVRLGRWGPRGPQRHWRSRLLQVPREHEREFASLRTFTCFNTNNLWVSVKALQGARGHGTPSRAPCS